MRVTNCIFENFDEGITEDDGIVNLNMAMLGHQCAFRNVTTPVNTNGTEAAAVRKTYTLSGSPFVNAGSGDFSLNNTAGAGAVCRAANLGRVYDPTDSGSEDFNGSLGAVQLAAAGGGSNVIIDSNIQIGL